MNNLFLLIVFNLALLSQNHLLTFPDISPDGKHIVFSSNTDLWRVPVEGGEAIRLTDLAGYEKKALFSPNGKYIVYSSSYGGGKYLRLINLETAEDKRLTYSGMYNEFPDSWSFDSKTIYFSSDRDVQMNGYKVSVTGGNPESILPYSWRNVNNIQPWVNGKFLYSDLALSFDYYWYNSLRIGYKGSANADVKMFDPDKKEISRITKYNGNDLCHKTDQMGNIYFISDRNQNTFNLYRRALNGEIKQLTFYSDLSIKNFNVTPNGTTLVFERDYSIYTLNLVPNTTPKKLEVKMFAHDPFGEEIIDRNIKITNFDILKKYLLFVSHGRLFLKNRETKKIDEIIFEKYSKVEEIHFLSEAMFLVNLRSKGVSNLFKYDLNTKKKTALTQRKKGYSKTKLNHKKTKAYAIYGDEELVEIDLVNLKENTLVKSTFWWHDLFPLSISSDDRLIAYQRRAPSEHDIFIYDTYTKKNTNITTSRFSEFFPSFKHDNSLYILADRVNEAYHNNESRKLYTINHDGTKLAEENSKVTYESITIVNGKLFGRTEPSKLVIDGTLLENISVRELFVKSDGDAYYYLNRGNISKLIKDVEKGYLSTKIEINYELVYNLKAEMISNYYEILENIKNFTPFAPKHINKFDLVYKRNESHLKNIRSRWDFISLVQDVYSTTNMSHYFINTWGKEEWSDINYNLFNLPFRTNPKNIITFINPEETQLELGDKLIKIDGEKVDPAKNLGEYLISLKEKPELPIEFQRKNKTLSLNIKNISYWTMLHYMKVNILERDVPEDIAYLRLNSTTEEDHKKLLEFINSDYYTKNKIILDLRYNQGGNRHHKMVKAFMTTQLNHSVYFQTKISSYITNPEYTQNKKMVVLINEETASDGELLAYSIKESGLGILIGQQTYGYTTFVDQVKTLNNTTYNVPYWSVLDLNKQNLEMRGVEPDILVPQELSLDGSDKQLGAAIRYLNETEVVRNKND